ncbi:hypothetical protein EUGRSUZ_H03534 [Eucalyptus grandis]|uniref:Uncharacterized protein n=2 Tax=Eucalyptus grandis TaxID=71139 RepID=A0ACC3JU17_EUCGR|nr:hypothetical protein EUGRSUZ_H03534 [Eucalyptus grandis]
MAMATQASLFTPALTGLRSGKRIALAWKQSASFLSFPNPRELKFSPRTTIRAAAGEGKAETPAKEEAPIGFTSPELDQNTPSPIFSGSTDGLLCKAPEQIFEMPMGGIAIVRQGPNPLKLARKEQCLALGTRLRSKYKIKYQFYRVLPNGKKVNLGREVMGQNLRSIGKNVSPIEVKFTGKQVDDL